MTADQPRADAIAARLRYLIQNGSGIAIERMEQEQALDNLLAVLAPADPTADHAPYLHVDIVCCEAHAATLCACGNFGKHVANVDCTAPADPTADLRAPHIVGYIVGRLMRAGYPDASAAQVIARDIIDNWPLAASTTEDEPDPNRRGMPKCSCGDIAYRPDPIAGRLQAWRCGGCHRTLSRCNCVALAASTTEDGS
jgi:hypothetical protein